MKKIMLLLMVVVLSVSCLAGCANQGADDIDTALPDSIIESAPTDTDPEPETQKPQNDTEKDDGDDDKEEVPDEKGESNTDQPESDTDSTPTDPETEPQQPQDDPETDEGGEKHVLDGKKVIFIGNSHTYYGKTVLEKKQSVLTQQPRNNDKGFFYQLCKANGADVSVTNWTFGGHDFASLFETCAADRGCDGVDHKEYLVDRNYDYVIMQQGSTAANMTDFIAKTEAVMNLFKQANPDTKFVFLIQHLAHIDNFKWRSEIKELENKGVIIVDWGAVIVDIMNGKVKVPGAAQTYNKNTFIISKSAKDGYHPNMLTGYITTLMTYCAITGDSAVGQDYSFCNDSEINSAFSFSEFIGKYYTYNNAKTNFPEVFASQSDMKGIQTLVEKYLNEKGYRNY